MIAGDGIEPSREFGSSPEGGQRLEGLDEDFLRQIGGRIHVARDVIAPRSDLGLMTPEQLVQGQLGSRRTFFGLGKLDQFLVCELFHAAHCSLRSYPLRRIPVPRGTHSSL